MGERSRVAVGVLVLVSVALAGGRARADDVAAFEHIFGATDINGAIGNGRVAAGFSSQGELTLLRWPSPSYYQHVHFVTSNADDARSQPHFGAADNQGSFAGLWVSPGPTGPAQFTWVRDGDWTAVQRYASDDGNQLVTSLHSASFQVTVTYTDAVAPDADVLVRNIAVTPDIGFVPTGIRLVYFENFAPTVEKTEFFPDDQVSLLGKRDYALGMSAALGGLVHFSVPGRPSSLVAPLGAAQTPAAVDAFLDGLTTSGTYIVVAGDHAPDGHQCGYDDASPPLGAPADAYADATATDGQLGGAPAVLVHADGALTWNLPASGGAVDVFIVMADTYAKAKALALATRARTGDAIRAADAEHWKSWLATATLPDTTDPDRLRIAKRALLSLAVGRDASAGAIVASVASQPAYDLDWPRDSAFIDYALDVAGYHDWAGQHRLFLTKVQRQADGDQAASGGDAFAGSFAMNFYADGVAGGPILFEIDEVGLTLWAWYEHAKWIDDPMARRAYLDQVYPSMQRAADLLTHCVDAPTGLQCAANEDDSFSATVTLHGAMPVRLGLASAVRAASYLGNLDDARRWRARLDQLDAAIEKKFTDPTLGYVGGDTTLGDVGSIGPVAWTLWPAAFHPASDDRIKQSAAQIVTDYTPFFDQTNGGGSYYGKGLVALALHYGPASVGGIDDAVGEAKIKQWIDLMVKSVPTAGTGHFGESFVYNGNGKYTDVVCIPHLWEATLTYLALMAAYSPDKFARPELASLDVPPAPHSGCGCATGGAPPSGGGAAALVALVALFLIARRRR